MPPRHGKTEILSRYGPAWLLGHRPNWRVLLACYEADFAAEHGKRARLIYGSYASKLFGTRLDPSSTAGDNWRTTAGGGMATTGVGGPLTGRGANLLLIDDPIKNSEDAASETMRAKQWDWFRSTAYTRLEPGGSCIIIMTRWHEEDLIGMILADPVLGPKWEVLRIPAIPTETDMPDLIGRQPGEPLWPQRIPLAELEDRRSTVGPYIWNAMYQGRPAPEEGSVFKKNSFKYWKPVVKDGVPAPGWFDLGGGRLVNAEDCLRFITVDTAMTTKTTSDFTVIGRWVLTDRAELICAGIWRRRVEGPDVVPQLQREYADFHPSFIAVESVQHGIAVIQEGRRKGLPVTELKADKDKIARAMAASSKLEAGQMFFEHDAPYMEVVLHEHLTFPNGAHDDTVDMVAYAATESMRRGFDWDSAYGIVLCELCDRRSMREAVEPCPHCQHHNIPPDGGCQCQRCRVSA